MSGKVFFRDLEIDCIVGCNANERNQTQPIWIDVDAEYDIHLAAESDQLEAAVDYRAIASDLTTFVQEKRFLLLERLAVESCQRILADKRITKVTLAVRKKRAKPYPLFIGVEYSLSRER